MTTYTFFPKWHFFQNGNALVAANVPAVFVVEDGTDDFSYSYTGAAGSTTVATTFVLERVNGLFSGSIASMERIFWGAGNVTDVLVVDWFNGAGYTGYLRLSGNALPNLDTTVGIRSFLLSITSIQQIPAGAFGPGVPIDFASISGGTFVENDNVYLGIEPARVVFDAGIGDDTMYGSAFNDNLSGGAGKDIIDGNSGNDTLSGGSNRDEIRGGAGDDVINGGFGRDILFGNGGKDTFVFANRSGPDSVRGFQNDIDTLSFDNDLWTELGNLSVATVISTFATTTLINGVQSVVFDFGTGDVVTVFGIPLTSLLADDIIIT